MRTTIRLELHQRAVVFHNGLPIKALGPGRHVLWGGNRRCQIFDTHTLLFNAEHEVLPVLPEDWFAELRVGSNQRAILFQGGKPLHYLAPGVHCYWTVDPTVEALVLSLEEPPPRDELLRSVIPVRELTNVLIGQHQRGLLYVEGRFEGILEPGRHVFWNTGDRPVSVVPVDMRRQLLPISGQELLTRDKVSLRLSLIVEWAPLDPETSVRISAEPKTALYGLVQLALRDYVAGVSLDELLEGRDELTRFLKDRIAPEAQTLGIRITRVGVKDIMLPGEMKLLLNRVIEAEKEAEANVILRREEAAATRAMANAAKVMAERPVLMRLKELEALKEIAKGIDEVRLVVGTDKLDKLLNLSRERTSLDS